MTQTVIENLKMLRDKEVADIFGISRSSVWRLAKEGRIPAPIKIGSSAARWRSSDIQNFLQNA